MNVEKEKQVFRLFRGRLAQYKVWKDDASSWEARWIKRPLASLLEEHANGELEEFEIFTRYLPQHKPVLEAGCGLGQIVMALSARGYQVEGVDYCEPTIKRIQAAAPQLNVRVGDVYNLNVPDGTYGGYISLGVFEHNPEGPQAGLSEVKRVLAADGVAFITVPYLNPKRQSLISHSPLAASTTLPGNLTFYQYYFARQEFEFYLKEAGLGVVEVFPYAIYAGLTRDFAIGRWLNKRNFFTWQIHHRITRRCREANNWARWRWAHMLMFVCKPTS
ncbi:MAG: class I SAM-dependent methyltransferase [Chloroflexi bacterium]|nr:MAG: class I SAM-dependent methyltransferase [Chloroflexota bacterium]